MKNYDKDKRELIFMGGLKGETLENVIDYWNVMNNNNTLLISVIDNPKVKEAIDIIKKELSKKPE
jgi:hypothetical protein